MSARRGGREGGSAGAWVRGLLGVLLLAVLLVFAASISGLLPRPPAVGSEAADTGSGARAVPALLEEIETLRREPEPVLASRSQITRPEEQVRVFLSNGCGVAGLAGRMREQLRGAGFDVCGVSTADTSDYAETVVIDRCGERWKAEAVCAELRARYGVGRLVLQVRNSPETDVLVILGADLAARLAGKRSEF